MLFTILIKIIDNILYQKSMRNSVTLSAILTPSTVVGIEDKKR